jgi:hypothetical protein
MLDGRARQASGRGVFTFAPVRRPVLGLAGGVTLAAIEGALERHRRIVGRDRRGYPRAAEQGGEQAREPRG